MGISYQQICGTSMEAPRVPAYTCKDVYRSPMYLGHILQWLSYIGDILILWNGTENQLRVFIEGLNIN